MQVALNASSYSLDEGSRQKYLIFQNLTFPSKVSFKNGSDTQQKDVIIAFKF
jgi:hypothetical protein